MTRNVGVVVWRSLKADETKQRGTCRMTRSCRVVAFSAKEFALALASRSRWWRSLKFTRVRLNPAMILTSEKEKISTCLRLGRRETCDSPK